MNSSFNEGVQFAWDATSITLYQSCPREYYYRMIENWSPRGLNANLRFGQHYATALEHFYKRRAEGEAFEDALIGIVEEALHDTWDRSETDPVGAPWNSMDNLKTRENLIRSIVWYVDHFESDPAPVLHTSEGVPMVEHSFALPVDNGIILTGHLDRVVEYAGHPYVMDQKTTKSTISPRYFDQFKPNQQMSQYTFAGRAIFGIPIKGVIIDAAQIAVGFTRFERNFTMRTEDELNEWYDTTMAWIVQAQAATRENHFPMNPASCHKYAGCAFRGVCSKSPDVRKQFLQSNFEHSEPWDPLKRR